MKWFAIILATITLLAVGLFWWAGKDDVELTDSEREQAPGQFLTTDFGQIHYVDRGLENGPVIVLVHGFSTPHFIFEQNAASLAASGFRVIQFDHFGRGWSDRPSVKYDADFYDNALLALLDGLDIAEPVGMVGLSMGGVISTEFAVRHPERVERLFLLVPTGLAVANSDSFQMKLTKAPIVGDWIWRIMAKQILLNDDQYQESGIPEGNRLQGNVANQMKYKGYFPALLSTLRHLEMSGRDELYISAAETAKPIMAVFGEEDQTIPFCLKFASLETGQETQTTAPCELTIADKLRELLPAADIRALSGADHGLNYKDYEIINPWMVEFFSPMLPTPLPAVTSPAAENSSQP